MFSSHVKGSPLEGTAAVPPSSATRERELSRSERKAARVAEERQARALREVERQAAKAGQAPPKQKPPKQKPAKQKPPEQKPGKEKARKDKRRPAGPDAQQGSTRRRTIKLARHPQESRPKAPLQPTVILKPKPSRRELVARAAQADPFAPRQKVGIDLALASLVLGAVALALSWLPIVKYVGAGFAAGGILLAVLDTRRSAGEGWLPGAMTRWARTLSVAALVVVVFTTGMAIKESADDGKKATGNATSAVLDDDLGTKWGEYTETTDSVGVVRRGLELTLKNKSGEIASYDILVEALNGNGERITSEQLLVRNMKKDEERKFPLFQFADDLTAKALKTAEFQIGNVRKF